MVRQLFEATLASAAPEERDELLAGAARLAEGVVSDRIPGPASAVADLGDPTLHGLYRLCANLTARQPLLLVVDDAQWLDSPSARWLAYVSRRLEGLPLLVLPNRASAAPSQRSLG